MTDKISQAAEPSSHQLRDGLILLFALFFPTLLTWAYFVYGKGLDPAVSKNIFALGKTLQFAFPLAITAFVLKTRWLVRKPNRRGLFVGGLFGLVVGAAIFFLGRYGLASEGALKPLFDQLRVELLARLEPLGFANRGAFLALCVFYSVCHSGLEEYYWRWFVFGRVSQNLACPRRVGNERGVYAAPYHIARRLFWLYELADLAQRFRRFCRRSCVAGALSANRFYLRRLA